MLGSAAIIVMNEDTCIVRAAQNMGLKDFARPALVGQNLQARDRSGRER